MKGLLRNNYYSMQESIKLSAFIALFLGVLAVFVGSSLFAMAISISILIFPVNIGSSLQTDETSKWNKFEITLPVSRSTIIKCKYLSYLMLVLIGLFCGALITLFFVIFRHEVQMQLVLFSYLFGLSLVMFTGALMYPLILKFGALKSELVIIVSVMGAMAFLVMSWLAVGSVIKGANMNNVTVGIVSLIASFLCFAISYFVSVGIHRNKEF